MAYLSGGKPASGAPELNYNYEIILAIANEGHTDTVMDAARAAGARGGTVLHGKGWYTGKDKTVVMCVTKRSELYMLEQTVHEIDPNAFMIISDAAQVLGAGFEEKDPSRE